MNGSFLTGRRYFSLLPLLIFAILTFSTGLSGQKVRLRSQITPNCESFGSNWKFADIFADGNIAVQGTYNCRGAFIYDITNPDSPILASWYNPGNNQEFLEAIVVGNRGYFGSGFGNGGVHIVDLSNPYSPVLLGTVDSGHGNGYDRIHEMLVWGNFLIENFNSTGIKPIRIIDISNPTSPVVKWEFSPTDPTWVHAMHIRGNKMYLSGWGGKIEIYDLTNIAFQPPVLLGAIVGNNNNHSTWTSEDGNYLYSCREIFDGDLRVYDVHNPANPLLVRSITAGDLGLNAVSPHNPVVKGNYLYVSWYQAGIQVFDITDPSAPKRVGQYDTYSPTFTSSLGDKSSLLETEPWDLICGASNLQNAVPSTYDGDWAVYPFLGQNKILAGDLTSGLLVLDATGLTSPLRNRVSDFDGDGRTDLSVFSPATGNWHMETSLSGSDIFTHFGSPGDIMVPGDYDGDGRSDIAVFRPPTGVWYLQRSTLGFGAVQFGLNGDIPVPADYDADGKMDIAVWRQSTGVWYFLNSTLGFSATQWGKSGDRPVAGDFEGDGKADIAVWRPSDGVWYVLQSSSTIPMYAAFGTVGDKPISVDFDGNGVTDFAVYRPSNGTWYILDPITSAFSAYRFGIDEDLPIPADYDGDSKVDISVFRPSTKIWYRLNSSDGSFFARGFGQNGEIPTPSSAQPQ